MLSQYPSSWTSGLRRPPQPSSQGREARWGETRRRLKEKMQKKRKVNCTVSLTGHVARFSFKVHPILMLLEMYVQNFTRTLSRAVSTSTKGCQPIWSRIKWADVFEGVIFHVIPAATDSVCTVLSQAQSVVKKRKTKIHFYKLYNVVHAHLNCFRKKKSCLTRF